MKILLPDSMPLDPTLPEGCEAVVYSAHEPIPEEHTDAEVLITWGTSAEVLGKQAKQLPDLRLVQSLAAGPDAMLAAGIDDSVSLCSGAGLHSETVAEHALALLLTLVRQIPQAMQAQSEHEWSKTLGGLRPLHPEGPITTLIDAEVLVWGFGQIGQHLAPMLRALGASVTGVARSAGVRADTPVITDDGLPEALGKADVLIMILPGSEQNKHALNAERLAQLKDDALLVNVGRGVTVDEAALVESLESGHLGGAGLDVTETEPLPADSPLWEAPRLLLTPHAAGGRPVGADELIAANVAALTEGGELTNLAR